jgi:phosphoglycolate phosphatase
MVGDTLYDILGAKEQGISSVAVAYGFGSHQSLIACNPDYLVDSVDELAELLF